MIKRFYSIIGVFALLVVISSNYSALKRPEHLEYLESLRKLSLTECFVNGTQHGIVFGLIITFFALTKRTYAFYALAVAIGIGFGDFIFETQFQVPVIAGIVSLSSYLVVICLCYWVAIKIAKWMKSPP